MGKSGCVPAISWAELCLRTETQIQMRHSPALESMSSPLRHSSSADPELSEHHPVKQPLSDNSDLNVGGALGSSTAWPHLLPWLWDSDKWLWPPLTCTDFWCGGGLHTGAPEADHCGFRMQHSWLYCYSPLNSQIIMFVRKCCCFSCFANGRATNTPDVNCSQRN